MGVLHALMLEGGPPASAERRSTEHGSLVKVRCKQLEEFELLPEDPYEPDEQARVMATRANIRPNF